MEIIKLEKNYILQNHSFFNNKINLFFQNYDIKNHITNTDFYQINWKNEFAGFFNIYEKNRIQKFFIIPKFQHKGLGSLAVKYILSFIKNPYCFVKKSNQNGISFWKKNNFIITSDLGNILKLDYKLRLTLL